MQEHYYLFYPSGSGGHFITFLTYLFLEQKDININLSKNGNAHRSSVLSSDNIVILRHTLPSRKKIRSLKSKMLMITLKDEDELEMARINNFFKYSLDEIKSDVSPWTQENILNKVENLQPVSKEIWNQWENEYYKGCISKQSHNYIEYNIKPYNTPNLLMLRYSDILSNHMVILENMSKFLDKPINDHIIKNYSSYIDKQYEFTKKTMLHHLDKIKRINI